MTYSLGEVEALARKAARGAGMAWGAAEEASKSVRWLCSWGIPGADALAGLLSETSVAQGPDDLTSLEWHAASGVLCPVTCGTLMSDLGDPRGDISLHQVAWPILILPHVAWPDRKISVAWGGTQLSWDGRLKITGEPLTKIAERVVVSMNAQTSGTPSERTWRADLTTETLATLNRFAARTYAPESEASKLTGAGAGLKDND